VRAPFAHCTARIAEALAKKAEELNARAIVAAHHKKSTVKVRCRVQVC